MTNFNRKYHPFTIKSSVSASPDFEVSTDGTLKFLGATSFTGKITGAAAAFTGIVSVSTVDFNATPVFAGIVTASVSNAQDITTHRMLRISNGTENFYVLAVTSASVLF